LVTKVNQSAVIFSDFFSETLYSSEGTTCAEHNQLKHLGA